MYCKKLNSDLKKICNFENIFKLKKHIKFNYVRKYQK